MNKMLFKPWKYSPQLSLLYKGLPNESSEELPSTSGQEKKQEHRWIAKYVALIMLAFLSLSFNLAAVILVAKAYRHGDEGHHLLKSPEIFSKVQKQLVVFQPESFPNVTLNKAGNPWDNLQPDSLGYIVIDEPSRYGLSGGYPADTDTDSKKSEIYCISMFHQLHCLVGRCMDYVRHVVDSLKSSIKRAFEAVQFESASLDEMDAHLGHCIDYLRQSIMCAGDLTLEKAAIRNGELTASVDGWGVTHECKNWNSMYDTAVVEGMLSK